MERNKLAERNTCIDVMKALLIIAMVIGHSTSPWITYIYLFHMPAFFVLSGYTYQGARYKVGQYIQKKFLTVLVPAVAINFGYIIFYTLMQETDKYAFICSGEPVALWSRVRDFLLYWSTPDLGGATWFLPVLFEVECIIKILDSIVKKARKLFLPCILGIGIGGYWLAVYIVGVPYFIDLAMIGCLYYGIGILIQKTRLWLQIDAKVMGPIAVVSTLFFGRFYFYGRLPMNWPTRDFANPFIQLWSCFGAFYLVWNIAKYLDVSFAAPLLRWIGRHTYCILITHFAVFRVLFWIGVCLEKISITQMQHLTPDAETAFGGRWILISASTVLLCCVIAKIAEKNKWTSYLFNAKLPYGR